MRKGAAAGASERKQRTLAKKLHTDRAQGERNASRAARIVEMAANLIRGLLEEIGSKSSS